MDGEPDPISSGPGPGGEMPDDPNAVWRRPGVEGPFTPTAEGQQPPASQGVVGRLTTWIRSWWHDLEFVQMWHVVAVAAILATAGFGGLDQVDKTPQTFDLGKPFDNGEFTITVKKAVLRSEIMGDGAVIAKEKPGRTYLAVLAEVTNNSDRADVVSGNFSLPNMADAQDTSLIQRQRPSVFRVEDGSFLVMLQPDITEKVAVVWSIPSAAVLPGSQVSVQVPYRKFSRGLVLYGEGWVDDGKSATTSVPVEVSS
ncbi:hypothetical protein MA5S0422_1039 [Mycobacteroides abscessus 5S-0422]|uniref:DUF4352 domain-containing protein n=1 Tax=Mycobacteroides abscessus subsp. bolletii 1513 TaxID=1299321 RepID=X8DND9_9MYCO|nr:hypothetical protein [Mycobacteroides abscessus]EUA69581.1 hypothetical protein I540_2318 [Mycobacteroides abscessus subsp. bolletii 1513]EIU14620.1 hypothetical protein MA5S0304_1197 [Mycobacteroides abscessus 5S-0304]EIU15921.1 hypothetical protein MA5S0421_1479 [Mycobacteroides abscessus 5S-0421]EIU18442.1 hypothetical protein MA5S0422_1039 [Mycobacteroides abscessus 5S-0422]EIU27499.1 hypothetical protein MA5S0817_1259 [Mycobacteroides abscessus 5S-0817]